MNKLIIIILLVGIATYSFKAKAQTWDSVGSGMNIGAVYTLAVDTANNILYAAGFFSTAGGVSVNNIAKWNGTSWDSLGSGLNSSVLSLTIYNNELYAGGFFSTAGGISVNNIAKWNGTSWDSVGTGMNNFISALAVYNDTLYAGGVFTIAGGVSVNNIAKWDGTNWSSVGTGIGGNVLSLAAFDTVLYVAGLFSTAGGVSAVNIAQWDGVSWDSVGSGLGVLFLDQVNALGSFNGEIYAGGSFITSGGEDISPYIARWNGASWDSVGTGMELFTNVEALATYNNALYAGGSFTTAGVVGANYIAKWNGISWDSLGTGMNGVVNSLIEYNGDLYAAGSFTTAGGISANRIARWNAGTPPPCSSSFTTSATIICEGVTINFTNTSTGAITYEWQENGTPFSTTTDTSRTFGTAGIYTISLIADSVGCSDSSGVIITVNPTYDTIVAAAICQGDSIQLPGGAYADTSGIYYDTLPTINSCDSVITTTLIVNPTYSINTPNDTICDGDSVLIGSVYRKIAGTYYDTLPTINSCDSVIATTLIVNPTYSFNTPNDTICDGDSIIIFSVFRKTAGTYYDTLPAINTCDSVIATTLIINPTYSFITPNDTICDGDSVMIFSTIRKIAGTYYDTLPTINSCDSVIATTLIVNPLPVILVSPDPGVICTAGTDSVTLTANGAVSYTWSPAIGLSAASGSSVNASPPNDTVYTVVGTAANGCIDSTAVSVQISTAAPVANFSASATSVCKGNTVTFNNTSTDAISFGWLLPGGTTADTTVQNPVVTYDSVGVFDVTLTALGCSTDSTITMAGYITVNQIYTITDPPVDMCPGGCMIIYGICQDTTGIYYDSLTTVNGCDSVHSTVFTVNPIYSINTPDDTICDGDSIMIFGIFRSIAGIYSINLTSVNGCDSTIITTLIVNSLPTVNLGADTTICNGCSITLDAGGFTSYVWSTGAITQTIIVDTTGIYSVMVTDANGCINADTIAVDILSGISQHPIFNINLNIHPNPNTGEFTVTFKIIEKQHINLKVFNLKGQVIYEENISDFTGQYYKAIDLTKYAKGIYNLQLSTKETTINKKIIVE